jgi:hypothetical protein
MSRTPARFTQADVARSIRAAKQAGAVAVELRPDGTIRISLTPEAQGDRSHFPLDDDSEVVL